MVWQGSPYSISYIILISLLSIGFLKSLFARLFKKRDWIIILLLILFCCIFWLAANFLSQGFIESTLKYNLYKSHYIISYFIPLLWFIFVLIYTGQKKFIKLKYIMPLSIIPFLTMILTVTNQYHFLIMRSVDFDYYKGYYLIKNIYFGYWENFVSLPYGFLLIIASSILLIKNSFKVSNNFKWQPITFLFIILIPVAVSILTIFNLLPLNNFEIIPAAFGISIIIIIFILVYSEAGGIVPLARERIIESLTEGIIIVDCSNIVVDFNKRAGKIFHDNPRIEGDNIFSLMGEETDKNLGDIKEISILVNGKTKIFKLSSTEILNSKKQKTGTAIIFHDVTNYTRQKNELIDLVKKQKTLNYLALSLSHIKEDIRDIYRSAYSQINNSIAFDALIISSFNKDKGLITAEFAVFDNKEMDISVFPPLALAEKGRGAQSSVIRSGEPLLLSDYEKIKNISKKLYIVENNGEIVNGKNAKENEESTKTAIYAPMKLQDEVVGIIQIQSKIEGIYLKSDIDFICSVANILAMAFSNSRLYESVKEELSQRQKSEKRLEKAKKDLTVSYSKIKDSLYETIKSLAALTELRDPYTAGHQENVAVIAVKIANILNLDEEKIEAIRVSSLLHDIGKINIPASILSKPGKLSSIEFEMLKSHSKTGYDILKNIKFPWPIAEIVLQHHERENGSGYPLGLKSENILIEAKVIGLSDVIEAMSSHRPYRPAHTMEETLSEIKDNSSKLYWEKAVLAAVELFEKDGFILERKKTL